jgi:hypothetical protein
VKVERFTSDIATLCYTGKSLRAIIVVIRKVNFGLQNVLNIFYAHLHFKNFFRGYTPGPPLKRERKGRRGKGRREGEEGKGREGLGEEEREARK